MVQKGKQKKKVKTKVETHTVSSLHKLESITASLFAQGGCDLALFWSRLFDSFGFFLDAGVLRTSWSWRGAKETYERDA